MKATFYLSHAEARRGAVAYVQSAPDGYVVQVRPKTRSLEQNARLWALLNEVAQQVEWYGRKLCPDEWKDVFTAALKKQDVVPGLEGGFVVLGARTSKMSVKEMSDLMELISAFGVERGVNFKEPT